MPERGGYNPENERPKHFVIAGIGGAKKEHAHDAALARLNEKPEGEVPKGFWKKAFSGTFWKSVGNSIWKQNLARDYYETKYQKEAEKKIEKSGSLYANEKELDPDEKGISAAERAIRLKKAKDAHDETVKSLTGRFADAQGDMAEDLLHKGEKRETLGNSEAERKIKDELKDLVRAYARGAVDEASLSAAKNAIFARVQGVKPDVIKKGEMYADNILGIAVWAKEKVEEQVKNKINRDIAAQGLDLDFDVVVAKAKTGVQTEAQFNSVERIVEGIQKHTYGIFNETAVTAAVAGAYILGKRIIASSVTKAAGYFGVGLAGTGAIAAGREGIRLEKERAQHAREMAQGRKFETATSKRRNELEQSRVEFRTAKDLEADVTHALFDKLQTREAKDLTPAEYQEALKAVVEIDSRKLESERGIFTRQKKWYQLGGDKGERRQADLIGYSDVTKVTQEQDRLDIFRAQAKAKLLEWALAHGQTKEQFKAQVKGDVEGNIATFYQGDQGITKKNEIFAEYKHKKMWQSAKRAMIIGGSIGLAIQEASAFHDDQTYGALEHLKDAVTRHEHVTVPGDHNTLLEGSYEKVKHLFEVPAVHAAGPPATEIIGSHHYQMDGDLHFDQPGGDPNHYYLTDSAGHHVSEKLEVDGSGNFTPDARRWLTDHGYNLTETTTSSGSSGFQGLNEVETHAKFPDLANHARVDWHDQKGSFWSDIHKKFVEFEGKQQMGYLEKIDGHVYLNCHKVIDNFVQNVQNHVNDPHFGEVPGYLNPDGSTFVDPQMLELKAQIIDQINSGELVKHFQAVIIPTDGANHEGLSDLMQGADEHGRILLENGTAHENWSQYFTDDGQLRDGHLPFRFVELRYDGHVMGTAQGLPEVSGFSTTYITPPGVKGPPIEFPPVVVPPIFYAARRKGLEETHRTLTPDIIPPPPPPVISGSESGAESGSESGIIRDSSGREIKREARDLQRDIIEVYFKDLPPEQKQERLVLLQALLRKQNTLEDQRNFLQFVNDFYSQYSDSLANQPFSHGQQPEAGDWDDDIDEVFNRPSYRRLNADEKAENKYYLKKYLNKNKKGVAPPQRKAQLITTIRLLNIFKPEADRIKASHKKEEIGSPASTGQENFPEPPKVEVATVLEGQTVESLAGKKITGVNSKGNRVEITVTNVPTKREQRMREYSSDGRIISEQITGPADMLFVRQMVNENIVGPYSVEEAAQVPVLTPEQIRVLGEIRTSFERDPLSFIYGNAGVEWQKKGIRPRDFVPALFRAEGLEDRLGYAQQQAKFMQVSNKGGPSRLLMQLTRLMVERNPALADTLKAKARDPKEYEHWVVGVTDKEVQDGFDRRTLTNDAINNLAAKFKLEPMRFMSRLLKARPSLRNLAQRDFENAGSPAGQREEILRKTLQRLQGRVEAPPRPVGVAPGSPRPISTRGRGAERNPRNLPETTPEDDTRGLETLASLLQSIVSEKKPAKKKSGASKKSKSRK